MIRCRHDAAKSNAGTPYTGEHPVGGVLFCVFFTLLAMCWRKVLADSMAKIRFIPASGTLAVYLSGEIDHHAAQMLRTEIDAQLDARMPELLTMDFSGVSFMDSSGVGLILGRGRRMQLTGGRLTVQNPPAQIRKMLDLARISYL